MIVGKQLALWTFCKMLFLSSASTSVNPNQRVYIHNNYWLGKSKYTRQTKSMTDCADFARGLNANTPFAYDTDTCEVLDIGTTVKIFTRYEAKLSHTREIFAPKGMVANGKLGLWHSLSFFGHLPSSFLGRIENFSLKIDGSTGADMAGSQSWIQFHLCNKMSECCTSKNLHDMALNGYEVYALAPTDPCGSLILDKVDPNGGGQSIEMEHFGPDGVHVVYVNIRVADNSQFHCRSASEGPANTFAFPDNARRRLTLNCRVEFVVLP